MCSLHYNRAYKANVVTRECGVDGCSNGQHAAGLCASHYTNGPDHVIGGMGWKPRGQASLYLIRDDTRWKYGKAMDHRLERRVAMHGWHTEVLDTITGIQATKATAMERAIKHALRAAGLTPVLDGTDGQTETHLRADLDPTNITELLELAGWTDGT
jgi:hypothetical protein